MLHRGDRSFHCGPCAVSPSARSLRRAALELESLEARRVFAVDFAFAGLEYRAGQSFPVIVYGEGSRADNGVVTGTTTRASFANGIVSNDTDIASMTFNEDGSLGMTFDDLTTMDQSSGADFRASAGFPIGYFGGHAPQSSGNAFNGDFTRYFLEQSTGIRRWTNPFANSLSHPLQFQAMVITLTGTQVVSATIDFSYPTNHSELNPLPPTSARLTIGDNVVDRTVDSIDEDGTIHFSAGDFIIIGSVRDPLAPDSSVASGRTAASVIYVDPNRNDGNLVLGVGGNRSVEEFVDNRGSAGIYRGSFQVNSSLTADFLGVSYSQGDIVASHVVLNLAADGTYRLWTAAGYDAESDPVSTGVWRVMHTYYTFHEASATLQLVENSTSQAALLQMNDDGSFSARWVVDADGTTHQPLLGEVARHVQPWEFSGGILRDVELDSNGHPQAYIFRQDSLDGYSDRWAKVDLIHAGGGKALTFVYAAGPRTSNVAISINSKLSEPNVVLGVDVDGHAVSYELLASGAWVYRDLSNEYLGGKTFTSDVVAGPMTGHEYRYSPQGAFASTAGITVPLLSGMTSDNHRVLLYPWVNSGATFRQTHYSTLDITQIISVNGLIDPGFIANSVQPLATDWGMIAVTGLDSAGHVQAIWASPGTAWYVNDLTSDSQGPALTGPLSLSPGPSRIEIFGKDAQGSVIQLQVGVQTGWLWQASNLTALTSGPQISSTLFSFHWLNGQVLTAVGGIDAAGNTVMYWRGDSAGEAWKLADLTTAIPTDQRPVELSFADSSTEYTGFSNGSPTSADQIHIYGLNSSNQAVRLVWEAGNDQWRVENISLAAVTLA